MKNEIGRVYSPTLQYDFAIERCIPNAQTALAMNSSDSMTTAKLQNALSSTLVGAALGATIGSGFVGAVCACGGTIAGPQGTFFGACVGAEAGASVGGFIGAVLGCVLSFCNDN